MMTTTETNRFWYEVYKRGVKHEIITKDDVIELATPINDDLKPDQRETVDEIYASIKRQIDDPEFDLKEASWFFDLAKTELKDSLANDQQ